MKQSNLLKDLAAKFKNMKNMEIIVIVLFVAVVVSIYASSLNMASPSMPDVQKDTDRGVQWVEQGRYEDHQELKLKNKLSAIKGAGRVEVMITYKAGKEIVTAMNTTESQTITEEQDSNGGVRKVSQKDINNQTVTVTESGSAKPLVLKEVEPEIKGVIVIAEGAKDIRVKLNLMRAVQTALGVSAQQVEVFEMEINNIKE